MDGILKQTVRSMDFQITAFDKWPFSMRLYLIGMTYQVNKQNIVLIFHLKRVCLLLPATTAQHVIV